MPGVEDRREGVEPLRMLFPTIASAAQFVAHHEPRALAVEVGAQESAADLLALLRSGAGVLH